VLLNHSPQHVLLNSAAFLLRHGSVTFVEPIDDFIGTLA
jgi:hypothetical protein